MILIDLFVLFYISWSVGLVQQVLILLEDTLNQVPR